MSESLVGFNVAATRQNAGRPARAWFCCAAVEPGGVNVPVETVWANVIVVSGNERRVRLSHVAAATGVALNVTAAIRTARCMILTATLLPPARVGVIVSALGNEHNCFCQDTDVYSFLFHEFDAGFQPDR